MSNTDYIDLIKLYTHGSANGWNDFLNDCYRGCLINKLYDVQRRLQLGMDVLVKQKLNTPEMVAYFCRLINSIDKTAAKIDKKLNPMLNDNPLKASKDEKAIKAKKERDANREAYRKKHSY